MNNLNNVDAESIDVAPQKNRVGELGYAIARGSLPVIMILSLAGCINQGDVVKAKGDTYLYEEILAVYPWDIACDVDRGDILRVNDVSDPSRTDLPITYVLYDVTHPCTGKVIDMSPFQKK